ncbi:UNVERIFIED_CONTAM: hypothetical protein RMT77_012027 [Armadillidium vulgare]
MIITWLNTLALTEGIISSDNNNMDLTSKTMCLNCNTEWDAEDWSNFLKKNERVNPPEGISKLTLPDIVISHMEQPFSTEKSRATERSKQISVGRRLCRKRRGKPSTISPSVECNIVNELPRNDEGFVDNVNDFSFSSDGVVDQLRNNRQQYYSLDNTEEVFLTNRCSNDNKHLNKCSRCKILRENRCCQFLHFWQLREAGIVVRTVADNFQEQYNTSLQNSTWKNFINESVRFYKTILACCLFGIIVTKIQKKNHC